MGGSDFYIIKCAIAVFCLSSYCFLFRVTIETIGKFGMCSLGLRVIVLIYII